MKKSVVVVFVFSLFLISMSFASAGLETLPAYGFVGTIPAPYDYDGDGILDKSVYHNTSTATRWYVTFSSGLPSYLASVSNGTASGSFYFNFGSIGSSYPIPGDYDGDGKTDLAVYTPSTANFTIRQSSTGQIVNYPFGWSQVVPVPRDYDGDGKTDLAVYYPAWGAWFFNFTGRVRPTWLNDSRWNVSSNFYHFGSANEMPAPGDYDGDGKTDLAVTTINQNKWYFKFSSGSEPAYFSNMSQLVIPSVVGYNYTINSWKINSTTYVASADYNSDGITDLAAYTPLGGGWKVIMPALPASPIVLSYPSGCNIGQSCGSVNISNLISNNFEVFWKYYYNDSTSKEYCLDSTINRNRNCSFISLSDVSNLKASYSEANSFNLLVSDNSGKVISQVGIRIAQTQNGIRSPLSPEYKVTNIVYGCTHECNVVTLTKCIDSRQYNVCGNFDSDVCYEWSTNKLCTTDFGPSYSCINSKCTSSSGVNCIGVNSEGLNLFCYLDTIILNSTKQPVNTCPSSEQACFVCDQNFTWNGSNCLRNNPTCVLNGGGCSLLSVEDAILNETLTCPMSNEACYICPTGTHPFNGSCISNNCTGGIQPTGSNFISGANITLVGSNLWNYSISSYILASNPNACEWKCDSSAGYRLNQSTNNTCISGKAICGSGELPGSHCLPLNQNGTILENNGNCTSSTESCHYCNTSAGYSWNGTSCSYGSCQAGLVWNGINCVISSCDTGCYFNGKCYSNTIRMVLPSSERVYCDVDNTFKVQKANNATCNYKEECVSNVCSEGKCFDIVSELKRGNNLLDQIICWIRSGFKTLQC